MSGRQVHLLGGSSKARGDSGASPARGAERRIPGAGREGVMQVACLATDGGGNEAPRRRPRKQAQPRKVSELLYEEPSDLCA